MASASRRSRRHGALARRGPLLLALAGALLVALAAAWLPAASVGAAKPGAADRARLDQTIRFLQEAQNSDGGFGGSPGAPSDPLFSAWVAVALAAGGVNPRDQALPGGADVYAYVARHAGALANTTDFERAALVAVAAGQSPRDFGGRDLVRAILARQLPDGAFAFDPGGTTGYVNATAFALLPLSTLREPAIDAALRRGADWLLRVQEPGGAWGYAPGVEPSSDVTASVIEALHAVERTGTAQEARAWDYLRSLHNADGGFGFNAAHPESNSASTSWVVQAMWAAGIDPAAYAPGRPSPLDYLASMQQDDGSIRWKADGDLNSIWMTAYAAPAYGGRPLPVATIARAVEVAAHRARVVAAPPARRAARVEGEGGSSATSGVVIAGGGGRGAPLFSAPQPQSQGRTAGGVRETDARAARRSAAAAAARANGGGGGAAPKPPRRATTAGAAGGAQVTGVVLGDEPAPAAPGLVGAQAGGRTPGPALALGLVGVLLLCAGLGAGLERRRPGALA